MGAGCSIVKLSTGTLQHQLLHVSARKNVNLEGVFIYLFI